MSKLFYCSVVKVSCFMPKRITGNGSAEHRAKLPASFSLNVTTESTAVKLWQAKMYTYILKFSFIASGIECMSNCRLLAKSNGYFRRILLHNLFNF